MRITVYIKRLSANDTGATGGHQVRALYPFRYR
ncbi:EcoRII N-terminal effector-binding domain-containing protein [Citrobacter portucalensis]